MPRHPHQIIFILINCVRLFRRLRIIRTVILSLTSIGNRTIQLAVLIVLRRELADSHYQPSSKRKHQNMKPMSLACQRAFARSEAMANRIIEPKPAAKKKKTKAKMAVKAIEAGLLVVIGNQLDRDSPVFIGWCASDGVADLLRRLQFGNPAPLALILPPARASEKDALKYRNAFVHHRSSPDNANWYSMSATVRTHLDQLKTEEDDDAAGS